MHVKYMNNSSEQMKYKMRGPFIVYVVGSAPAREYVSPFIICIR